MDKQPKTIAEMLPGLSGLLTKEAMQSLTAKKAPRKTIPNVRTDEKVIKQPLTLAEMRADLQALMPKSPRPSTYMTASNKKKWNSSVKLDKKTASHTAGGQMKHTSVRKVLNFQQPKPRPPKMSMMPNSRMPETPKFPKLETKFKKPFYKQGRTNERISGVYQIPETPVYTKPAKSRMTLADNKKNVANQASLNRKTIAEHQLTKTNINKKLVATPKSASRKRVLINIVPDTPLSNESWKSSCDASFLQNEKEIDCLEEKTNATRLQEQTFEDITEILPPVSTPFKDYRNVTDFFNNSSVDNSSNAGQDNTIMTFDQLNKSKQNGKKEDSVVVSLCELLNKATVSDTEQPSTELEDLLKLERQTENNIKIMENNIRSLENIKEFQLKSLQYFRKLIQDIREKVTQISESEKDETVIEITTDLKEQSPQRCSVIKKLESPSFKIPKKNTYLRKKVLHKSMSNISYLSPQKDMGDRAFNMYMQMKERMQFLSTPLAKMRTEIPDTPAITSHNLQKQLDKLYTES